MAEAGSGAVGVVADQDVVAGPHKGHERFGDGADARGEDPGQGGLLQILQRLLQRPLLGQAVCAVCDAGVLAPSCPQEIGVAVEEDGGAALNRRVYGTGGSARRQGGVDQSCRRAHGEAPGFCKIRAEENRASGFDAKDFLV